MRSLTRRVAVFALCFVTASLAWAQWNTTQPRDGACFYVDYNFRGQSFCLSAGQNAPNIPSGMNDRIRSIRVFGRARVQFFNDANFRGVSGSTSRDISDLRRLQVADDRNKNWNVRISSVQIDGGYGDRGDYGRGGWWGGDRDRDRDHDGDDDRDDNRWHGNSQTVNCSSDTRNDRQWCRTNFRVNRVRMVNQNGRTTCEYDRTFGIDDGRLWTGRGCSGTFEVR